MTPDDSKFIADVKARVAAAICPRCKGSLVHDFEGECWTQDRCTDCGATWFNDPPRPAASAPFFRHPDDIPRLLTIIAERDKEIRALKDNFDQLNEAAGNDRLMRIEECKRLRKMVDVAREALFWYARQSIYRRIQIQGKVDPLERGAGMNMEICPVEADAGSNAITALTELDRLEKESL